MADDGLTPHETAPRPRAAAGGSPRPGAAAPTAALFASCAGDLAMARAVEDTVTLLEAAGFTVAVPEAQTCCGQMALNSGHPDPARVLMRRWVDVFAPYDLVVSPSGSCTSTVAHHFPRMLDGTYGTQARALAERTRELTQVLADTPGALDRLDLALDTTVAWHDSCHMMRALGETDAPRTVLAAVRGLTLTEVPDHDVCCGFGGTFSTKFPELSCAMADRKLTSAATAGVYALVSADPGCVLHLASREAARRADRVPDDSATPAPPPVVHVAALLRAALSDRRHLGLAGAVDGAARPGVATERRPA